MKRRKFVAGVGTLAAMPAISFAGTAKSKSDDRQYLEWIKYTLAPGSNKNRVEQYYQNAAIPALNKLGIKNIGVFNVTYGLNEPALYVLIPHDTMESALGYQEKLLKDETYKKAGAAFHESEISNPAYLRIERGLMRAFKDMPKVESSKEAMGNQRIFELRIYESHNYVKGQKKIDMFNEGGEIAIFRETGLTPVFFGETIFGPLIPNLTYMLVFKNMAERDKNWATFVASPKWDAIKDLPIYKDTVSNITDFIMKPAACSQL